MNTLPQAGTPEFEELVRQLQSPRYVENVLDRETENMLAQGGPDMALQYLASVQKQADALFSGPGVAARARAYAADKAAAVRAQSAAHGDPEGARFVVVDEAEETTATSKAAAEVSEAEAKSEPK